MHSQSLFFFLSIVSLNHNNKNACHAVWMNPSFLEWPLETTKSNPEKQQKNAFVSMDPQMGPPPRYQIGSVDEEETEFNVGNGFTDESNSRNIVSIRDTSGTNIGLVNLYKTESRTVPGTTFYEFNVLAPGCSRIGDAQAIQVKRHFVGYDSVEITLEIYPWHGTLHDVNGDQSELGVCLQAHIFIVDGTGIPQVVESKHFELDVTVLVASFAFKKENKITLLSVERWPRPCA